MASTLVKGASVVEDGRAAPADVLVADGRIGRVDRGVPAPAGAEVVEAGGLPCIPG